MYLTQTTHHFAGAARPVLNPASLLELAGGGRLPDAAGSWPDASGVDFHSGRLQPGDAFFALPGDHEHGINHAGRALEAGASFVVSDRPHPRGLQVADPRVLLLQLGALARDRIRGRVVGVTGSAGKTTAKDLLRSLLAAAASPGNLNTPLALSCTLVRHGLHDPGTDLVLELGIDQPGEMRQLLGLTSPDIGLLTSIAPSHLESLGDLTGVASEKRQLLDSTRRSYASSQAAAQLDTLPEGCSTYGLQAGADDRAELAGKSLRLRGHDWQLAQPGRSFALNVTGALCLALDLGIEPQLLQERLAAATITPGRLQLRSSGNRTIIDDSYNSNPASAASALEVLFGQAAPRVAILGDMRELGEASADYHRELGAATRGLDLVIAVGEFADQVKAGNPQAVTASDTDSALALLPGLPVSGTVLVKASRSLGFERLVQALEVPA